MDMIDPQMMLARSLMQRQPTQVRGPAGALANLLAPMAGMMFAKHARGKQEKQQEAETSAMGRLLAEAEAARAQGGDPREAIRGALSEGAGDLGATGRKLMESELSGILSGSGERKTARDVAGRLRYLDNESLAFPGVETPPPNPGTGLVQVYDESSPTGSKWVPKSEAAGQPGKAPSSALSITGYDDKGRPLIQMGGKAPGITKPTRTATEKQLINKSETLAHLSSIRQRYRPEFQQVGTRWDALKARLKSKAGISLAPEESELLQDYSAYRADAGQLFANTLKDLSGVAVNPTEFKRAEVWLPNPGTGLFDGDSPEELESKIERFEDFTKRALMKRNYILRHGLDIDDVDVDDMPGVVRKRGNEIEKQYREDFGLTGEALGDAVRQALTEEFGAGVGR
jgi:hypothetical protein